MEIVLKAPAKINWSLEVLGRRPDGYHEIRSVLQTIDLCDRVTLESHDALVFSQGGPTLPEDLDPAHNLAYRAALLLRERSGCRLGASINLTKLIPAAAGLGGGSSDAAAVLRGLNVLWSLNKTPQQLAQIGAELGSDVPFFLFGGTALAEGRGERILPLPDAPPRWLVVAVPPVSLVDKTRRMYGSLTEASFSDGSLTCRLTDRLREGQQFEDCLNNVFQEVAFRLLPELGRWRDAFLAAGAAQVHLAGSGPALLSLVSGPETGRELAWGLTSLGLPCYSTRTLTATEALEVIYA